MYRRSYTTCLEIFEESERLFLEDIEISTEMGLNGHLALIYGNLGDLYLDMDQVPKAIGFY